MNPGGHRRPIETRAAGRDQSPRVPHAGGLVQADAAAGREVSKEHEPGRPVQAYAAAGREVSKEHEAGRPVQADAADRDDTPDWHEPGPAVKADAALASQKRRDAIEAVEADAARPDEDGKDRPGPRARTSPESAPDGIEKTA
jgi:hypothetical protein